LIVAGAVVLFVTRWLRVDVVGLMVLVSLAMTGLVTPRDALSGFSNPAVVTVWAVFILSGALSRTGVAGLTGRFVMRLAGGGETRLIVVIMLTSAILSAFMNNVGVAALLLPVVMDISRRTRVPASKLLIPLAFSSLLGGLMTQIGTPPNILVTEALVQFGEEPFELFDFTPVGSVVMVAGIVYMALVGKRFLPVRETSSPGGQGTDLARVYAMEEGLSVIRLPPGSDLEGKTLKESRLGSALGVNVLAVLRERRHQLAPDPATVLSGGDRLLVEGDPGTIHDLAGQGFLTLEEENVSVDQLVSGDIDVAEVGLTRGTDLEGQTLRQVAFRQRFGVIVLAIRRDGQPRRTHIEDTPLRLKDVLLVVGDRARIDDLRRDPDFIGAGIDIARGYHLEERLMRVRVPDGSALVGRSLVESHLGDRFGLGVIGFVREGVTTLVPSPIELIRAGDILLMKGRPEDLEAVDGLHRLEVVEEADPEAEELETEKVGLAEAVLSPRSALAGTTLMSFHFREKYGLSVIAVSREGRTYRTNLGRMRLHFGDALLLHGPREKLVVLGGERDFIVLQGDVQRPVRAERGAVAAAIMIGVVLATMSGWLPIYIAAVAGATATVLTRCVTIEEAYHYIEWRAVFLIAGMIPLGIAMRETGAAQIFTESIVFGVAGYGSLAVMAAIFIATALGAQLMPTSAVTILMAPIAFKTAKDFGISPQALMMTVAMSASLSFLSPVAHPANVLIMGPGGYRFSDYTRVGLPLVLVCFVIVMLVLPIFWPL